MNKLFLLTEYPSDVLPMYAQGYSVCRFLIDQQGPRTFIQFLHDYMQTPSWTANIKKHYGYESLAELQNYWLAWVGEGSGSVEKFAKATPSTSPASGALAVASLNAPRSSSTPKATALASIGDTNSQEQGWYLRRRNNPNHPKPTTLAMASQAIRSPASGKTSPDSDALSPSSRATSSLETPGAIRMLAPPSIQQSGPYSAAQPQPEQQISRANMPSSGLPLSESTRAWDVRHWR
jgi:hypothetical protein